MRDPTDQDISRMSLNELRQLADRVDKELHSRREEGHRWLRQHGLVEHQPRLYRNPQNSRETWSGRGEHPAWVKTALASGMTLAQLEADGPGDRDLPIPGGSGRR